MYKVLVIGEANSGKTSMVTIQCEFGTKVLELDNQIVNLQLWDIAGQDRMASSMTKIFCRGAQGALVVFDITCPSSMTAAQTWKNKVAENAEGEIPFILCANKADLEHTLTEDEVRDFASENGFSDVFLTSAKTGLNTAQAVESVARNIRDGNTGPITKPERGATLTEKKPTPKKKKCC